MIPSNKNSIILIFITCLLLLGEIRAQTYLKGSYVRSEVDVDGDEFAIYNFSRKKTSKGVIKAKYFALNANQKFENWKDDKKILFYCSGAFSESWDTDSPPLGICVDNGEIVNRNIDQSMDGLVIVYNGGAQKGGIAVINIDKEHVKVDGKESYNLRSGKERMEFLNWAKMKDATVFQTQMMYTKSFGYGFPEHMLTYGERAERRFLAICMKKNVVYHIVIDYPESNYLNKSAANVIKYLSENLNYEIYGLFNLDTGGKNIMRAFDDSGNVISQGTTEVEKATNLLVYYVD